MKHAPLIAIAGHARSGKDTLGKHWKTLLEANGIKAQTFAFAAELKDSVDDFLKREVGISAWTEDSKEKEIIRPFLVFWGTEMMRKLNDNVWVERAESHLLEDGVSIITDVRFENELDWAIERKGFPFMIHRDGYGPANETEAHHGGILQRRIEHQITLADLGDGDRFKEVAAVLLENLISEEIFNEWKATYPL